MTSLNAISRKNSLFDQGDESSAPFFSAFQVEAADWSATLFAAAPGAVGAGVSLQTAFTVSSAAAAPAFAFSVAAAAAPAWVGALANAGIAANMRAAIVDGVVKEPGLAKLMTDLAASLGAGKLSASQFNDLKIIAANLNTGVSTSAYVNYAFNALVNGNAANAKWTGGAATSVALGNLAVGSTAAKLSQLTGKWLLGTDLPSSAVVMGSTRFSVTSTAVSLPLFGAGGPSMNDINQGRLGDCYFLASISELALQKPSTITSMFTDNGNNSYGVRFYVKGVAQYVTVNNALPGGGAVFNHGSTLWASLAEKAYAQFQSVNAWGSIGNGGNPINALAALTGSKAYKEYWGSSTGWSGYTLNSALSITGSFSNLAGSTMLTELIAHLNARDDVILCSYTNAYDSYGKKTLISSHAMSIYGYNATTGMLQVRNPWGSATNQSWATTFEVSLSTLQAARDWIMVDNAGAGLPTTPVLLSQTPTQNFVKGLSYAFSVAGAFADPDGAALTYTATQTGGSALPGWLAFNASTGQFTAAPLASASGVSVIVTAKDSDGYASSETFAINVASALAPKLKAQTANKTAVGGKAVSIALASNTFVDPQGETMSYSATQASGAALPNWLSFDAAKRLFSGTTPTSGGTYALKVTATNTGGASASETFNLKVSASAAKVASLIAGDAGGFFSPAPQAAGAYAVLDLLAPAA